MTLHEAIEQVDALKPNGFSREEKIGWLSDVDRTIFREIHATHGNPTTETFAGYDGETDMDTEMLAEPPYDILYRWYLESQIDLYNMEMDKYNNSAALYNSAYAAYRNAYNRSHMPVQRVERFRI